MTPLPPVLRSRRSRWLAAGVALLLAVRIALPSAIAAAIAWGGERTLGVPVSVADVDLGVLLGRVRLEGLAVAGPGQAPAEDDTIDPETALLRFDRLDLDLEWLALLRGRIQLAELALAAPTARVELDAAGQPILPSPPSEAPEAGTATDAIAPPAGPEPEAVPEPGEADALQRDGGGWPIHVDRFEVTGLALQALDGGETPAIELGLEALRLADVAFGEGGLALGAIDLDAPTLRIRRDFALAPSGRAPAASEPPASPRGEATSYRMERLQVERAEFVLLTDAGPLRVAVQIDATGVTSGRNARFPAEVRLEIEDGVLEILGELGTSPLAFAGRLTWSDLPLPPIAMLLQPDLAPWFESHRTSGELDVDLRMEAEGDRPAALRASGRAASHDLAFRDPESEALAVGWQRLEIPIEQLFVPLGAEAEAKPVRAALGAVRLVAPRVRYQQPSDALDRLAPPDDAATPQPEPEPRPDPIVSIASLELADGEIDFRDASVEPAYEGTVRELGLQLRDVRLPARTVGSLSLSARLPERSTLALEGTHGSRDSRLALALEQLPLSPFNPYAVGATGYRVEAGRLRLETQAERSGDRWDIASDLVLRKLALSGTGSGALEQLLGIPVDVAMALLRDLEGDIRLGVPVTFQRGKLSVGIGSVLRNALRAAVAGAVTSPLKMMGAVLDFAGGGGLAVAPLRMAPGTTALQPGHEEDVRGLVELLQTRPELAIRLRGGATPDERDALAERMLIERIQSDEGLPEIEDAGFFARRRVEGALESRGQGEPAPLDDEDADLLARYRAAISVPPERFEALARARAEVFAEQLREGHGVAPDQVRVADDTDDEHAGVSVDFAAR